MDRVSRRSKKFPCKRIGNIPPSSGQFCGRGSHFQETQLAVPIKLGGEQLAGVITGSIGKIGKLDPGCQPKAQHGKFAGPLLGRQLLGICRG